MYFIPLIKINQLTCVIVKHETIAMTVIVTFLSNLCLLMPEWRLNLRAGIIDKLQCMYSLKGINKFFATGFVAKFRH